jgi:hypothetical protein
VSLEAVVWALNTHVGDSTRKLVLVAIANHAQRNGTGAWASADTYADYAECSERTAQRHIAVLLTDGLIREGDQSVIPSKIPPRYRPIVYDLAMSEETRALWAANPMRGRRAVAAASGRLGAERKREGRQDVTPEGRQNDTPARPAETPETGATRGDIRGDIRGDAGVTQTQEPLSYGENNPFSSDASGAGPGESNVYPMAGRPDVERLCALLADLIEGNGANRPPITKAWRDAARRMLDLDRRNPVKAEALIRWCQADEFWCTNILSMPTFRKQYEQLRLKANADWARRHAAPPRSGGLVERNSSFDPARGFGMPTD